MQADRVEEHVGVDRDRVSEVSEQIALCELTVHELQVEVERGVGNLGEVQTDLPVEGVGTAVVGDRERLELSEPQEHVGL